MGVVPHGLMTHQQGHHGFPGTIKWIWIKFEIVFESFDLRFESKV